jgi:hypothetical protein
MFYNSTQFHSYLGYVSPNEYEGLANGMGEEADSKLCRTASARHSFPDLLARSERLLASVYVPPGVAFADKERTGGDI